MDIFMQNASDSHGIALTNFTNQQVLEEKADQQ
jgi:hypothetical protein